MKDALTMLSERLLIDASQYSKAIDSLYRGQQALVVVGGKMTAGKDTVAPELTDIVPSEVEMLRYGNLMRADLRPGLDYLTKTYRGGLLVEVFYEEVAERVADIMSLRPEWALELVQILAPEVHKAKGELTPESRTDGIRIVLQNLGEPWRCEDDEDYWARPAAIAALKAVSAGKSVILTGGRYLPDVEIPRAAGATLVRLDVTRETQLRRLSSRDGLAPDPETLAALDHRGETALDDYTGFHIRVDNDDDGPEGLPTCLTAVRGQLWEHLTRRSTAVA